MSRHHEAGKGSKRRQSSVDMCSEGWDRIFKNDYQDILSTEECILAALETLEKEENNKQSSGDVK
jgi:hypothetical protein